MEYKVKTLKQLDWNGIERVDICSYAWGRDYTPKATAMLVYVENEGFALKMECMEKTPRTTYYAYGDPVYRDSAMEFFASFNNESKLYMNFEMNSAGTFLSSVRLDRKNKTPIDQLVDISKISVKSDKNEDNWSVEVFYPLEIIKTLFGVDKFPKGYCFKGNFYKCGDDTDIPHFGSWSPIDLEKPNFHCPEFFGTLIID